MKQSFEGIRVTSIDTPLINTYIEKRLEEGAANATINRELAALKRMPNIGAKQTSPKVDLDQSIVRLEAGGKKNNEGRTIYLDEELEEALNRQWETRKKIGKLLPYVFLNGNGYDKLKRFDKSWKRACENAGISVRLFHNFRRTAVRNMVRAGIPERVAMVVSGHKTRSVFEWYNIVNYADLELAAQRIATYQESQVGTKSGTIIKAVVANPYAPVAQVDRARDS